MSGPVRGRPVPRATDSSHFLSHPVMGRSAASEPPGAMPTARRSVLPAFFVAKLSTLDEEQELGDAAPEGDPTGNTVPFASEESAEAGQASDELEHGPVGGRPALGVLR